MLTAQQAAEYFLNEANDPSEDGDLISNLKLQKLLYYAQGLNLALYDEPLFNEKIMAWMHGPVVPEIWQRYKDFGSGALPASDDFDPHIYDDNTREVLDEVYDVFGQFSAWKLRDMTHEERPWKETPKNQEISLKLLTDYFKTRVADASS